jgi:hypothetical protein
MVQLAPCLVCVVVLCPKIQASYAQRFRARNEWSGLSCPQVGMVNYTVLLCLDTKANGANVYSTVAWQHSTGAYSRVLKNSTHTQQQ